MRRDDTNNVFRPKSGRFFMDTFGWWAKLREGEFGPFPTAALAEAWVSEFLNGAVPEQVAQAAVA